MSSIYGKKMMSLIRAADIAPKKKGYTPSGYGVFSKRGSGNTLIDKTTQANKRTTNKGANKGTQGDYIYFKKIIPSQGKIPTK